MIIIEKRIGSSHVNSANMAIRQAGAICWKQSLLVFGGTITLGIILSGIISIFLLLCGLTMQVSFSIGLGTGIAFVLAKLCLISAPPAGGTDDPIGQSIDLIRLENVVSASAVDDLEDFGPGYVIDTEEGERVFFAGERVGEIDHKGESLSRTIEIDVNSGLQEVVDVRCFGPRVNISASLSIRELPIEPTTGFAILRGFTAAREVLP